MLDLPRHVVILRRRTQPRVPTRVFGELRCVLWPGGLDAEPVGEDAACPAWAGNVLETSRGGLSTCVERSARDLLAIGDRVAGRLYMTSTGDEVLFEARVCHMERFAANIDSVGLQFTEMSAAPAEALAVRAMVWPRRATA